jgi:hypothetical protein
MSDKKSTALKLVQSGGYVSVVHKNVDLELFKKIHDRLQIYPELGECSFILGKLYFTAKGAKRIAHAQKMKGVKFEYVNPEEFAKKVPWLRQEKLNNKKEKTGHYLWEQMIIVKAFVQNKEDGWVQGMGIVDIEVELAKRRNKKTKEASKWGIKELCYFTETKSITRAIGNAYSIEIFDDLPNKMKKEAIDVRTAIEKKYPNVITVEATEDEIALNIDNFEMKPQKKTKKPKTKKSTKKKIIELKAEPSSKFQFTTDAEGVVEKEIATDLEKVVIEEVNKTRKLKEEVKTGKKLDEKMKNLTDDLDKVKYLRNQQKQAEKKDPKKEAEAFFSEEGPTDTKKSKKTLLRATNFFDSFSLKEKPKPAAPTKTEASPKIPKKKSTKKKKKVITEISKKKKSSKKKKGEDDLTTGTVFIKLQDQGEKEYDYYSSTKGGASEDIPYSIYLQIIKAGIEHYKIEDPELSDLLNLNLSTKNEEETYLSILKMTYEDSHAFDTVKDITSKFKKQMKKIIKEILDKASKISKTTPNDFMLEIGKAMKYTEQETLWLAKFLAGNKLVEFNPKGVVYYF